MELFGKQRQQLERSIQRRSALGLENFSTPRARFREGYREITHESRKTSKMSNANLFKWCSTLLNAVQRCPTLSKHSDDENVDFSLLTNLISCRTLNLTILNAFPAIAYLIAVEIESLYDIYNSRYRLSKFSYFSTLVDCTLRLLPNDEPLA